jgi:hypothetical protein
MSGNNNMSERLRFNLIDQETVAALREVKAFALGELPTVLDGFTTISPNFPIPLPSSGAVIT